MLSYRHSFHAGNHADVLKHLVLIQLLQSLKQKDKGFLYLDTHSGAGRFNLSDDHSQKTLEYVDGIGKIYSLKPKSALLDSYFKQIDQINPSNKLDFYPGSPILSANLLRMQDIGICTELHPNDFSKLKANLNKYHNFTVHNESGIAKAKAVLPPTTRRGLIFIDPSYELKEDFDQIVECLNQCYKRFANGIYAIWYPVIFRNKINQFISNICALKFDNILQIELLVSPDNSQKGMTGSGMIIINPNWKTAEELQTALTEIKPFIAPKGSSEIKWLKQK